MTPATSTAAVVKDIDWSVILLRIVDIYGHEILWYASGCAVLCVALIIAYRIVQKKFFPKQETLTKEILRDQLHVLATTLMSAINLIAEKTKEYNTPEKVDIFINGFYQGALLDIFWRDIEKIYTSQAKQDQSSLTDKISRTFEISLTEADREANKIANVKEAMLSTEMKLQSLESCYTLIVTNMLAPRSLESAKDDIRGTIKKAMMGWTVR